MMKKQSPKPAPAPKPRSTPPMEDDKKGKAFAQALRNRKVPTGK